MVSWGKGKSNGGVENGKCGMQNAKYRMIRRARASPRRQPFDFCPPYERRLFSYQSVIEK